MKKVFTTLFSLGMITGALAQWSPTSMKGEKLRQTKSTQFYSLDLGTIRSQLSQAQPMGKTSKPVIINLPTLDGKIEQFAVYSLPVVAQAMADRYQLGSYTGVKVDDPTVYVRFSVSPYDFQSMVFRNGQYEFIEPENTDKTVYGVFPKSNKPTSGKAFECSTGEGFISKKQIDALSNSTDFTHNVTDFSRASDKKYRTYRLAISVTGEYTTYFGGVPQAAAAINATMTRVNGVFEKDFAIHLNVQDLPQLIYTNAATDPYSNASTGAQGAWNLEIQQTLTSVIGNAAYDVGHLFGRSGGGGSAGDIGNVCRNPSSTNDDTAKGSGFTSPGSGGPEGDTFDIDYVAHELGHQLGAEHTFTHTIHSNVSAMEPGSGSTIMGYAGITSANVQMNSDPYFHGVSIFQVDDYVNTQNCGTNTPIIGNNPPVVAVMADKTIPKGTAFVLTAAATDAENDTLNYTWEQYDVASSSLTTVTGDNTNGPKFRSLTGTEQPYRYFPKLSSVLNGTLSSATDWEAVPNVARTMNFRVTVRDNNPDITKQQTQFGNQRIIVGNTTGPFKVSSTKVYNNQPGAFMWDVVGTNAAPYNVSNVKIDYTTDNGANWTVLAASTPNDGTEILDFATLATNTQLIVRVSAIDNVFYATGKVTVSAMVNCDGTAPVGVIANSITQTGARIDWDPIANATYNLKYKKTTDTNWTEVNNLTSSTYTIAGLTISTAYNVSVLAVCSGTPGAATEITFTTKGIEYCAAGSNNATLERISNVTFANINRNSTATTGYENFTTTVGDVTPGQSYNFSASHTGTTYSSDQVLVWIDYNKDGDFDDAGERVLVTPTKLSPWTGSITIPTTATAGQTRMRVRLHDSSTMYSPNATPCGNSGYGQVEDYTLNIGQLAVSDIQKSNISVYPNPATDVINISNVSSKTKFEIYNIGGQMVNQGTTDGKVNVSKLTKGVYILTVESNGEKSQTKFIKN